MFLSHRTHQKEGGGGMRHKKLLVIYQDMDIFAIAVGIRV